MTIDPFPPIVSTQLITADATGLFGSLPYSNTPGHVLISNGQWGPSPGLNTNLNLNGNFLELTDGGGVLSVDLSSLAGGGSGDADWLLSGGGIPTNITSDIYTEGRVGIGTSTPSAFLEVKNDINGTNSVALTNLDPGLQSSNEILFNNDLNTASLGFYSSNFTNTDLADKLVLIHNNGIGRIRLESKQVEFRGSGKEITFWDGGGIGMGPAGFVNHNRLRQRKDFDGDLLHELRNDNATANSRTYIDMRNGTRAVRFGINNINHTFTPFLADATYISFSSENFHFTNTGVNSLLTIKSSGNVGIGTSTPACPLDVAGDVCSNGSMLTSDLRFKKNIGQIENPLEKIMDINGVRYQFRSREFKDRNFDDGNKLGLIAQNIEEVFPELVKTFEDGYKAVNYDGLIPVLIEGVKEQQQQIDLLQNESEKLHKENTQLREDMEFLKKMVYELQEQVERNNSSSLNRSRVELEGARSIILDQNAPNPFKDRTVIGYVVPQDIRDAQIFIYNIQGQVIKRVPVATGEGQLEVFASNLSAGLYSYSLVIDGKVMETKKMVLKK